MKIRILLFWLMWRLAASAAEAPVLFADAPLAAAANPTPTLQTGQVLRLWPGDAPLAQGQNLVTDIPTLTVFLPAAGRATGSSMVICPGGGYQHLADVKEGSVIGEWLAANGITSFVLKYRLGPQYHHPAELDDVQRALRQVRAHAVEWKLDPARVGILGFSAGGHLASSAATHFADGNATAEDPVEHVSSRPDVQVLLYPVITLTDEPNVHKGSRTNLLGPNAPADLMQFLSSEKQVTKDSPPAFIVHSTADTTVPVANSDAYVAALMKYNIPVAYLRANYGGHGFGLTDGWNASCIAWLRTQKF